MLEKSIQDSSYKALKAGNKSRLSILRLMIAELQRVKVDKQIDQLEDAQVCHVLMQMNKQRQNSLSIYLEANRQDLAEIEQKEIEIISEFLPEKLSDEALISHIQKAMTELKVTSKRDMGRLMKHLSNALSGQVDMKHLSQLVQANLD